MTFPAKKDIFANVGRGDFDGIHVLTEEEEADYMELWNHIPSDDIDGLGLYIEDGFDILDHEFKASTQPEGYYWTPNGMEYWKPEENLDDNIEDMIEQMIDQARGK